MTSLAALRRDVSLFDTFDTLGALRWRRVEFGAAVMGVVSDEMEEVEGGVYWKSACAA